MISGASRCLLLVAPLHTVSAGIGRPGITRTTSVSGSVAATAFRRGVAPFSAMSASSSSSSSPADSNGLDIAAIEYGAGDTDLLAAVGLRVDGRTGVIGVADAGGSGVKPAAEDGIDGGSNGINAAVAAYVQSVMEAPPFGLERLSMDGSGVDVFVEPGYANATAGVLFVMQGSGGVRAGQWSRGLCLGEGLATGSILPLVAYAQARGWGVVVSNPNEPAGGSPQQHTVAVWDRFLADLDPSDDRPVVIFAHSYGGVCLRALAEERGDGFAVRVARAALTDAVHRMDGSEAEVTADFFKTKVRAYLASSEPLDAELSAFDDRQGTATRSAGHPAHPNTNACSYPSSLPWLLGSTAGDSQ